MVLSWVFLVGVETVVKDFISVFLHVSIGYKVRIIFLVSYIFLVLAESINFWLDKGRKDGGPGIIGIFQGIHLRTEAIGGTCKVEINVRYRSLGQDGILEKINDVNYATKIRKTVVLKIKEIIVILLIQTAVTDMSCV